MDWLPNKLSLSSSKLEDDYKVLYEVFERDFINTELNFRGEKVTYQEAIDRKTPGGYPHGFTHLVTRENGDQRIIDYDRATRLPWVRAIIEHSEDEAVSIIEKRQVSQKYGMVDNTYLWLEACNFLVILRRIKSGPYEGQMLVTSYAITEAYQKNQLRKYREQYEEKENAQGTFL